METKKPTVTIGIPAYNEEANIAHLLEFLLDQRASTFIFESIMVNSDGSQDRTDEIIAEFAAKDARVLPIGDRGRLGQGERQNQIFARCTSDIVILLNADILIKDSQFIEKLIEPIASDRADLTSCRQLPLEAKGWFERVVFESYQCKNHVFESYRGGVNYFNCHGSVRAFSRELYTQLRFPQSVGEDIYSFFFAQTKGLQFEHVSNTAVYFKCAENWVDYKKQSVRFVQSKNLYFDEFDVDALRREYAFGWDKFLRAFTYLRFNNFVYAFSYGAIFSGTWLLSWFARPISNTWDRSMSTTTLVRK